MKKISEIYMYVLGALVIIGFFVLLVMLLYVDVPAGNIQILNIVVGALIGSFTSIVGYYFGSSKGSKDKTQHLVNKALS